MIEVWDILSEILSDLGLTEIPPHQPGPGGFKLIDNFEKYYMGVWCPDNRFFKIYHWGYTHISIVRVISGGESVSTDIDLCEPDSLELIREIILNYL